MNGKALPMPCRNQEHCESSIFVVHCRRSCTPFLPAKVWSGGLEVAEQWSAVLLCCQNRGLTPLDDCFVVGCQRIVAVCCRLHCLVKDCHPCTIVSRAIAAGDHCSLAATVKHCHPYNALLLSITLLTGQEEELRCHRSLPLPPC